MEPPQTVFPQSRALGRFEGLDDQEVIEEFRRRQGLGEDVSNQRIIDHVERFYAAQRDSSSRRDSSIADIRRESRARIERTGPRETGVLGELWGRGVVSGVSTSLEGLARLGQRIEKELGENTGFFLSAMLSPATAALTQEPVQSAMLDIAQTLDEYVERNFPEDEGGQQFWSDTLPQAVGSLFAFPVAIGMSMGGQYREARNAGMSHEEALDASVTPLTVGAGLIEYFPLGRALSRATKVGRGLLGDVLTRKGAKVGARLGFAGREALAQGGIEALEEITQGTLENINALKYDPDRELTEGLAEGGAAGGIVGALMSLVGLSVGRAARRRGISREEAAAIAAELGHADAAQALLEGAVAPDKGPPPSEAETDVEAFLDEESDAERAQEPEAEVAAEAETAPEAETTPEAGAVEQPEAEAAGTPAEAETGEAADPGGGDPYPSSAVQEGEKITLPNGVVVDRALIDPEIGVRRSAITRIRAALGLDPKARLARQDWEPAMLKALGERDADGNTLFDKAFLLITQAQVQDSEIYLRGFTDPEMMAVAAYHANLVDTIEKVSLQIDKMQKGGDAQGAVVATDAYMNLVSELDFIHNGLELVRNVAGRSLNILKVYIDKEDLSITSLRARARKMKGMALSEAEDAEIRRTAAVAADVRAEVDAAVRAHEESEAGEVVAKEARKSKDNREELLQKLDALRESGKLTPLNRDASLLVGRLAMTYARDGGQVEQDVLLRIAVDKTEASVPEFTRRDVMAALGGRHPEITKRAQDVAKVREKELREMARAWSQIIDTLEGRTETKAPSRREESALVKSLKKDLWDIKYRAQALADNDQVLVGIQKRIDRVLKEIEDGDYKRFRPRQRIDNSQILEAQETLAALNADLRRVFFENMAREAREGTLDREAALKYFAVSRPMSAEVRKKQAAARKARRDAQHLVRGIGLLPKWWSGESVVNVLRLSRAALASADISWAMRQGVFQVLRLATTDPIRLAQVMADGVKGFSRKYADEWTVAMQEHPAWRDMEDSGVFLSEYGDFHHSEELFERSALRNLPLIKTAMRFVIEPSERSMTVGLNALRMAAWESFTNAHRDASPLAKAQYATWLNRSTGRGDLRGWTHSTRQLSEIFFAPKFMMSRFQSLGLFLQSNLSLATGGRVGKVLLDDGTRARQELTTLVAAEIWKDWMRLVGFGSMVMMLAKAAGELFGEEVDVGLNPRDSDFGKIVVGNTRIDLWASHIQVARLAAQLALGVTDRVGLTERPSQYRPLTGPDGVFRFFQYKLSPAVLLPFEAALGRNIIGEPVTPLQTVINAAMPIAVRTMAEEIVTSYKKGEAHPDAALLPLEFLGVNTTRYTDELKSSDVKPLLDRSEYRPTMRLPEKVRKKPKLKRQYEELFGSMLADEIRMRHAYLESAPPDRAKKSMQKYASRARKKTLRAIPRELRD